MGNTNVEYNIGKVGELYSKCHVSGKLQNVFTITKYSGVDPEVPNGMDNSFYPRPRIYTLSLGIEF